MHPEQKRIYQSMTPSQKLKGAMDLYYFARELKAASLKSQHPNWTKEKIIEKVREIFIHAGN